MESSRAIGLFLIAGVFLLVLLRFYIHRPLPKYETPLAEEELRTGRLTPPQYVELGYIRQDETLKATQILGLPRASVVFLGYPDRGLAPMWEQYWDYSTLFASRYTRISHSPYRNSFQPEAPYCGQNVVDNLKKIITGFGPTQILVTHPNDAHPDHWATFALVTYADFGAAASGDRTFYRLAVTPPGSVQAQISGLAEGPRADEVRAACRAEMAGGGLELEVALPAPRSSDGILLSVESQVERSVIDRTEWTVLGLR